MSIDPLDPLACCCADWVAGIARSYAGQLASIARHEGIDAAEALDVVQDAFHTFLQRPDSEHLREDTDGAVRLLSTITRNAARNLRRRHHRSRPHVDVDDAELHARGESPVDALERATTQAQLNGCMASLGDAHRHVITLRVLEELTGDEAAAALGLTANHVNVLLHRARKQLAACMLAQAS
ncbi:MAG TPA: sigma-70 family RNA polymerase sigma factor [Kofleriaceae bacterium]|jgi:RNA polymerase sigma-70 factor (ECF subfamily)